MSTSTPAADPKSSIARDDQGLRSDVRSLGELLGKPWFGKKAQNFWRLLSQFVKRFAKAAGKKFFQDFRLKRVCNSYGHLVPTFT